jgi:SNF2 family DNA or RNA helicase
MNKLIKADSYVWLMTGTPAAQSPEDAYGLAKLINAAAVPRFSTAWRDKVMRQITKFKWVAKDTAYEEVHRVLQPAIRFTKAQCLDLPPVIVVTREPELTPQQIKYYRILKDQMLVRAAGETISAINAAASVNKLLQISAGAAYTDNGEVVEFDCNPRLRVLLEVLEETSKKVLVFAPYRHSIDTIGAYLDKQGITHKKIHGDVTASKRALIFNEFQTTQDPRVLVIQPQAASHGVTLTAADTVVFWGPVMSVETYLQCIARADRVGQIGDKVTVVHIQASEIERRMFKQLGGKVDNHSALIKLYEEELADDKI